MEKKLIGNKKLVGTVPFCGCCKQQMTDTHEKKIYGEMCFERQVL